LEVRNPVGRKIGTFSATQVNSTMGGVTDQNTRPLEGCKHTQHMTVGIEKASVDNYTGKKGGGGATTGACESRDPGCGTGSLQAVNKWGQRNPKRGKKKKPRAKDNQTMRPKKKKRRGNGKGKESSTDVAVANRGGKNVTCVDKGASENPPERRGVMGGDTYVGHGLMTVGKRVQEGPP